MYNFNMLSTVLAQLPDFDAQEEAFGNYRFSGGAAISDLFDEGLINIIFFLAGAAFLLYLISGGISMMTSRGDPKSLEAAKAKITSGLTGFVIIFTAYWIVQVVGILLGLEGFRGVFGG